MLSSHAGWVLHGEPAAVGVRSVVAEFHPRARNQRDDGLRSMRGYGPTRMRPNLLNLSQTELWQRQRPIGVAQDADPET